MDLGLKNKSAAVAASSRGLGFAAALELAREGTKVGICSRDKKRVEEAAEKITRTTGGEVLPLVIDVSDAEQAERFVDSVGREFGRLDILVTNAGGPPPGCFADLDINKVRRGFELTLLSAVAMMKCAVPWMKKNQWGRIVNIVSITVKQPEINLLMSNTMRSGIVGFAKSIATELAKDNILINNVAPGYTKTERLAELAGDLAGRRNVSEADVFGEWEAGIPMGRLGRPEELAKVIAFLSSEASSYVTGATLQVDGGFVQGVL